MEPTSRRRARSLTVRSNLALAVAVLLGLFLGLFLAGSGGHWSPWAARFAAGVVFAAAVSLACRWLAHQVTLRGDAPPVTHPSEIVPETASEVAK